ncbi:cytochrome c oxidase assembly protein [Vreelandella titanicae]|uniref:Cytochrome c oxidase caa3-type, assembly factor CtaG-related protein n=1 Tax=Vreelandella titanicae BH1 TaxID=1204738 RepID=L9U6Q1_9GAMM|nr:MULTISPECIES: cytochrome c oxidase assembly protein [Halomonas]ELY20529.1 Cytochrome c oxidase caa3-type, assembly factor CtaG-related protein [Halomonas titanicae BH1]
MIDVALSYLKPWEFSLTWATACVLAIVLYFRGLRQRQQLGESTSIARILAYLLGVAAIYGVTLTHYDYLAQYMFFAHRAQHLVLHHAAPFLIALAAPLPVLIEGLPMRRSVLRLSSIKNSLAWMTERVRSHGMVIKFSNGSGKTAAPRS